MAKLKPVYCFYWTTLARVADWCPCICVKADDVRSLLQAAMPATQMLPVATKSALLMSPMLPVSPQSTASSPTYVVLCIA